MLFIKHRITKLNIAYVNLNSEHPVIVKNLVLYIQFNKQHTTYAWSCKIVASENVIKELMD